MVKIKIYNKNDLNLRSCHWCTSNQPKRALYQSQVTQSPTNKDFRPNSTKNTSMIGEAYSILYILFLHH